MYSFLDKFFLFFHTIVTLFNLLGWIWPATRTANLVVLLMTGGSWFILGIWYGMGYCLLTDLHWKVLRKLGKTGLPNSYIKYILDRITGLDFNATLVSYLTVIGFFCSLLISIYLNLRDRGILKF